MPCILVVDDMAIIREPIAAALRAVGCRTLCAVSGEDALVKLRTARPDLVLLDVSMPGMDGIAVLRHLRGNADNAAIPVVLLTGSNDKAMIVEAAKLGVRDCMLKSGYTTDGLLSRVKKYVDLPEALEAGANSSTPPSKSANPAAPLAGEITKITKEQFAKRLRAVNIQMVSGAVAQLMSLASSPQATLADVARCLKQDPGLSTRVLTISNSAAFATNRRKIVVIEDAVRQIGLATVQNLAASIGILGSVQDGPDQAECMRRWEHSLAVAAIMEKLAQQGSACAAGVAYLVGLCHELPEVILQQHFSELYDEAVSAALVSGRGRREELADRFGIPFHQVASTILTQFNLPQPIVAPLIEFAMLGIENQRSAALSNLTRLLDIADLCAHGLLLSPSLNEIIRPLRPEECHDAIGADPTPLDLEALRSGIVITSRMLLGNSTHLKSPMATPQPLRVVYLSDDDAAALDPLRILLQRLVTDLVTGTADTLASASLSAVDAIVVASDSTRAASAVAALASPNITVPILYLTSSWPSSMMAPATIRVQSRPITLAQVKQFLDDAKTKPRAAAA